MTRKQPEDVIDMREKSLRQLNESQEELKNVREMLRKAVVRLSIAARCEDDQLNQVLDHAKAAVKNDIDLGSLDISLDKLLVQINRPENGKEKTSNHGSGNEIGVEEVRSFADEVRDALALSSEVDDGNAAATLRALAEDIARYAESGISAEIDSPTKTGSDVGGTAENINQALIELLNGMNLPESTRQDHESICRQLDRQLQGIDHWKVAIESIGALINKSIWVLQREKKELQVFIKKMTDQLADIDQYVRQSRQDRIDTVNESTKLKDTVDTNVVAIQETVGATANIVQLKHELQDHLSEIRKRVEEHQQAESEREEISKKGYAHIISELARTQKETLMLKEQLQESQQKMLRDPLTGLPNRLAYEERVAVEINRSRRNNAPLCLAMWDIDHFKKVNDTYGHDAGDRVLKLLSKIIINRVRKVDMFARIGGEEFVLLMPDTAIGDALSLNNELRKNLEESGFNYRGSPCQITSSVGIAAFEEYDTPEQILYKADKALYQSKREGRNRCTIYTQTA